MSKVVRETHCVDSFWGGKGMSAKLMGMCGAAVLVFAYMAPANAADTGGGGAGGPGGGKGGKHPPNPIEFILKHASDLNLTADQTTKLKALEEECKKNPPPSPPSGDKPAAKGGDNAGQKPPPPPGMDKVKDILTPDQMEKLKELHPKGDHPKPPKP